jgi:hypothetical protein
VIKAKRELTSKQISEGKLMRYCVTATPKRPAIDGICCPEVDGITAQNMTPL